MFNHLSIIKVFINLKFILSLYLIYIQIIHASLANQWYFLNWNIIINNYNTIWQFLSIIEFTLKQCTLNNINVCILYHLNIKLLILYRLLIYRIPPSPQYLHPEIIYLSIHSIMWQWLWHHTHHSHLLDTYLPPSSWLWMLSSWILDDLPHSSVRPICCLPWFYSFPGTLQSGTPYLPQY